MAKYSLYVHFYDENMNLNKKLLVYNLEKDEAEQEKRKYMQGGSALLNEENDLAIPDANIKDFSIEKDKSNRNADIYIVVCLGVIIAIIALICCPQLRHPSEQPRYPISYQTKQMDFEYDTPYEITPIAVLLDSDHINCAVMSFRYNDDVYYHRFYERDIDIESAQNIANLELGTAYTLTIKKGKLFTSDSLSFQKVNN